MQGPRAFVPVVLTLGSGAALCGAFASTQEAAAHAGQAALSRPVGTYGARPVSRPNEAAVVHDQAVSASAFAMTESLASDHPLVRLRDLERLRNSLETQADDLAKQRDEVAQELRATRESARAAAEALHSRCVAQAERILNEKRDALYAHVNDALSAARVEPLAALRVELDELVSGDDVGALDEALHELAHSLEDGLSERVPGLSSTKGLKRIGNVVSSHIHERVQGPWSELRSKHSHYAERLGATHDERVEWAAERVESIRNELHERIDCAVERSLETFSKRLEARTRDLDVPRSGELDAALEDITAQLDAWTSGFITGTTEALAAYRAQVEPARAALRTALPAELASAMIGWSAMQTSIGAALEVRYVAPGDDSPQWRLRECERAFLRGLRGRLDASVHDGRDTLRDSANDLRRRLHDEKQRSDEAWDDLRDALKSLHSRVANDCWKLDGPHLDGRFAPKLDGKFVRAGESREALFEPVMVNGRDVVHHSKLEAR